MGRALGGVLPILQTPFTPDDEIDREILGREIDWALESGADGVCTGMVSEVLRLTEAERMLLAEAMVEFVDGRGATVASVGAENTKSAMRYARAAESAGCTAVMAIPPVGTILPETSLWGYFADVADAVNIPLVVQDASAYVGVGIPISFYVRLLDQYPPDKILFKPEAAPIGPRLSLLRDATSGRARCFDGSGGLLLTDVYPRGLAGTMPGADIVDGIVRLWRSLAVGDRDTADRLAGPIGGLITLQMQAGLDGYVAIEKYLLRRRGLFQNELRRSPYAWDLDPETQSHVDRLFSRLMQELRS